MGNFYIVASSAIFMYVMCWVMVVLMLKFGSGSMVLMLEWEFSEKLIMESSFVLVLDFISCLFGMTVFFISGSVMLFSGFYMSHESFLSRFVLLVLLFVLSMIMLVLFPSFICLMVGWDGLGVVSFLLVIYYMDSDSLSAGMITAISNRIGDVFYILMIGVMCSILSFNYSVTYLWCFWLMGLLVVLGSFTKSAQIPFSAWLPEAMAAPTPVSTLVHSSTLVTAGVYVLIRFGALLSEFASYLVLFMSMMTVIMAGSGGLVEVDMKKVVALSTLSQVGMMMFAISMGAIMVSFFHLVVHAFFKALMFMCVGGVIFYSGGFQDARFLGGLWVNLPFTCGLLVLSNMSLMGFPFLSGFYSKELILAVYLTGESSLVGGFLVFLSLAFTMGYSIRMMFLMMTGVGSSGLKFYSGVNVYYLTSLIMMMNGAVCSGAVIQFMLKEMIFFEEMSVSVFYSGLVLVCFWCLNMFMISYLHFKSSLKMGVKSMLSAMWFLKELSGNIISSKFLTCLSKVVSFVEMGWIRSYVWGGGLKKMVFGMSNSVHKGNFNMIGLMLFFSLFIWVVIMIL
uniref:NADH:ubiquinone reductase (H(+)-translocating) n=1 Tax=Antigona lamellaris TaxID=345433 RepID=A0A866UCP0_9BIVA|nr:NADH dehydrogenase subunit 5 [Antigona lamellaris]